MKTAKPGQAVAFAQPVIKRIGSGAAARGTIVEVIGGKIARVDFHGTWIDHEDGGTIRTVPLANLTPILANGAIFGD